MDSNLYRCEKLLLAILWQAIADYLNTSTVQYYQVEAWLFSDSQKFVFSFVRICGYFGYDIDYLRRMTIAKKERKERGLGMFLSIADEALK